MFPQQYVKYRCGGGSPPNDEAAISMHSTTPAHIVDSPPEPRMESNPPATANLRGPYLKSFTLKGLQNIIMDKLSCTNKHSGLSKTKLEQSTVFEESDDHALKPFVKEQYSEAGWAKLKDLVMVNVVVDIEEPNTGKLYIVKQVPASDKKDPSLRIPLENVTRFLWHVLVCGAWTREKKTMLERFGNSGSM